MPPPAGLADAKGGPCSSQDSTRVSQRARASLPSTTSASAGEETHPELWRQLQDISNKHHAEIQQCIEVWLRRHEDQHRTRSSATSDVDRLRPSNGKHAKIVMPELEKQSSSDSLPQLNMPMKEAWSSQKQDGQANSQHSVVPTPLTASTPAAPDATNSATLKRVDTRVSSITTSSKLRGPTSKDASRSSVRVNNLLTEHAREGAIQSLTPLQRLVTATHFEWFTGFLIIANAVFIGIQTQVLANRAHNAAKLGVPVDRMNPPGFIVIQILFCLAFTVELGLRWGADGFFHFFNTSEKQWNIFDFVVVIFGLTDVVSTMWPLLSEQDVLSNTSVLRVMRVIRVVRVARVIRIMRFFRELRMMIFALLGSIKPLCWALILLLILFFIFAVSLTTGTVEHLDTAEQWQAPYNKDLVDSFGSLDASILTLYMSMSGGKDWADVYDILALLPAMYRAFFLVYISFAIFAVVNIVTGIFVDSAFQANHDDRDVLIQEETVRKEKYLLSMQKFFEEMDADQTGCLSLQEFESKLDDARVITYFDALKLDVSDARKLFSLLDHDRSGEIDISEFLLGCQKLKGESRALDMAVMQAEISWMAGQVSAIHSAVEKVRGAANT